MARFRVTCKGNRGEASRLGHTGCRTEANAWGGGVEVEGCGFGDSELFNVRCSGGSNGNGPGSRFASVEVRKDGSHVLTTYDPRTGDVATVFTWARGDLGWSV